MKKLLAAMLALLMTFTLPGCALVTAQTQKPASAVVEVVEEAKAGTVNFTDSLGREVELPTENEKDAVSGPLAQIALFALCPDKLVGVAGAWDAAAEQFLDAKYFNLPELGQLYGGKGELNLETLLASGAQVVIDVGEPKKTANEDLDALQEQTGIPFVHITATTEGSGDAYRKLGELLNMPDAANKLADYCDGVYERTLEISNSVQKKRLLYITGDKAPCVIAKGSYHAEIIDLLSDNIAVVDEPSSKGTGNETDMEQLLEWNPDVIIFAPNSFYASAPSDHAWQKLAAIQSGAYYETPFGPYNWMGFPPSVQRYLGMLWLARLLYPEAAEYDLYDACAEYYGLFYHSELSREQFDALTANSTGKLMGE